jgi:hypothetical protein
LGAVIGPEITGEEVLVLYILICALLEIADCAVCEPDQTPLEDVVTDPNQRLTVGPDHEVGRLYIAALQKKIVSAVVGSLPK